MSIFLLFAALVVLLSKQIFLLTSLWTANIRGICDFSLGAIDVNIEKVGKKEISLNLKLYLLWIFSQLVNMYRFGRGWRDNSSPEVPHLTLDLACVVYAYGECLRPNGSKHEYPGANRGFPGGGSIQDFFKESVRNFYLFSPFPQWKKCHLKCYCTLYTKQKKLNNNNNKRYER